MRLWRFGSSALGVIALACGPRALGARPSSQSLTLLYTADIHSHLLGEPLVIDGNDAAHGLGAEGDTATVGGVARIATLLAAVRAEGAPTVYLDAGDLLEGTSFFPRFGGEPEMRSIQALGVDAMAAGNHDLGFGIDALGALRHAWARFPLVAANLPDEQRAGLVTPVAFIERGGVRVAVIGLGRRPDGVPSLGECAAAVAAAMGQARVWADLVILLSHLGRDADFALVPLTTGIDLVIGGHTHDLIDPPALVRDCGPEMAKMVGCSARSVPVVHPGAYGRYVGRADLVLSHDPRDLAEVGEGRTSAVVDARFQVLPVNATVSEDANVAALIAPYAAVLDAAGVNDPIAFAPVPVSRRAALRGDSPLGDFVADAIREGASADFAVINTTGIRADIVAGSVTPDDLVRVLPFSDDVVTLELSGDDLLRAMQGVVADSCRAGDPSPFQIGGGRAVIDCAGGGLGLEIGGEPLDGARRYRIAAASFLTEASRWLAIPSADPPSETGETVEDAVAGVLRERAACPEGEGEGRPCLTASADGRIAWH